MIDSTFNTLLQGQGLVGPRNNDDNFTSLDRRSVQIQSRGHVSRAAYVQNSSHSDCQSHLWYLGEVVVKEARVGKYGIVRQSLDPRSRSQTRSWFIEGNVAVGTDSPKEQVDTTDSFDLFLVGATLCFQIRSVAIQDVDVGGVDVDMGEEMLVHEAVIAFWMLTREAHVFVLRDRKYCQWILASGCHFKLEGKIGTIPC